VSATSRAIATARARASVCFRDAERAAEYDVARADFLADSVDFVGDFAAGRAVVREAFTGALARALVVAAATSVEAAAIPMRPVRAIEAYSESFLFKRKPLNKSCTERDGRGLV